MNQWALCGLLIFLTSLFTTFFVFLNNRKEVNLTWSFFTLLVSLWGFGLFRTFHTLVPTAALYWSRFHNLAALFIPPAFLHFVYALLGKTHERKKIIISSYVLVFIYFLFSFLYPQTFILSVLPKPGFAYYPEAGPLYFIFPIFFTVFVSIGIWEIYRMFLRSRSEKRNQFKYLFLGMFIGFSGGATTFPLVFNIPIQPYGAWGVIPYVFLVTYAILKYNLMDIRVIINRTAAWILTVILLASGYLLGVFFYAAYISQKIDALLIVWTILYGIFVGEFHQKIRFFIQTTAEKKFLKSRYNYRRVLSRMSQKLAGGKTMGDISAVLEGDFKGEVETKSVKLSLNKE